MVMSGAVGGVIILSLQQRAKNMQSANTDDDRMLAIATISTAVANNTAPNMFIISQLDLRRRLMYM